jgi:hypothetical protein
MLSAFRTMGTVFWDGEGCMSLVFAIWVNHKCYLLLSDTPEASFTAWRASKEESYSETRQCTSTMLVIQKNCGELFPNHFTVQNYFPETVICLGS